MRRTTAVFASLLFAATAFADGPAPEPRVYRVRRLEKIAAVRSKGSAPRRSSLSGGDVIDEGFENSVFPSLTLVPGAEWRAGTLEGFRSDVTWGTAKRRGDIIPAGGAWHAYPVGSGQGSVPAGDPVPSGVGSVLTVGPFDFSQVSTGTFSYDILERTDDSDPLRVCWSTTPLQVLGSDCFRIYTLDRPPYQHEAIDLHDLVGRPTIYFWWLFTSGGLTSKPGVFIDNVEVSTGTTGSVSACGVSGLSCSPGFFCDYSTQAFCQTSSPTGACQPRSTCPQLVDPYCACSGNTYANLCELAQAGELRNYPGTCVQCPDPPPSFTSATYRLPGGPLTPLLCGADPVPTSAALQISWGAVPSADGYDWEVRKKSDCRDSIGDGDLVASGSTSGIDSTTSPLPYLPEGTYCWRVRSHKGSQSCAFSPCCCFRIVAGDLPGACTPGATTLCIDDADGDRRFKVSTTWATTQGAGPQGGDAHAIPLSGVGVTHGGLFWFSSADNPEVFVKVLNACAIDGYHWVFISSGTDLGFDLTITDTQKTRSKTYSNADRSLAAPVRDYRTFPCD